MDMAEVNMGSENTPDVEMHNEAVSAQMDFSVGVEDSHKQQLPPTLVPTPTSGIGYMAELSKRLYVINLHFQMTVKDPKSLKFSFKCEESTLLVKFQACASLPWNYVSIKNSNLRLKINSKK